MEKIEPFNIIGITVKTQNKDLESTNDIGKLWNRFMTEDIMAQIPNKIDHTIYSVYTDYEGDYTKPYTVLLGCRVKDLENIPNGFTGKRFSGGQYNKYTAKGNIFQGAIYQEWLRIWGLNLPRAYTYDFEVYGEKAANPENAEVDIFIAIK